VSGLDVLPHDHTGSIYSAFVEDQIALVSNKLWLTMGSKLEHNNYTGLEVQPSVRALWKPDERQSLWTAVTHAVRTPSRLEESLELIRFIAATPPTFLQIVGNSDFQSERLLGYEAGYRTAIGNQLFVDISVFHNRHDRLESLGAGTVRVATSPAPTHVLFVVPYANTIRGQSNGIEIAPDWKPTSWWQLKASYSHLGIDLRNTLAAPDPFKMVEMYEGSSPRHRVVLRPLLTLPKGWEIDQTYRYISALPSRAVDAYHALDLRLGWRARSGIELSVVGQNLLQGHHVEFGHDPGPAVAIRRSVYASATWRR
jgi:iron complex outermembrane receptor protein